MAQAAQASRVFRVFVSSTFEDFKAERNALQQYVFPRLAELCASRGARFQAIDLRWGVSEEASLDQHAIPICLTEIERCQRVTPRPNFIVLLGDRYGWRPLPSRIDAKEFDEILAKVPKEDATLLVWAAEQPSASKGWYRRDDNAVPPEYVLRPREVAVPKGATAKQREAAQDAEYKEWVATEGHLRAVLLKAIEGLGWGQDDPPLAKYVASATEQEIVRGALEPKDAAEHVFGFFRSIEKLPADEKAKGFCDLLSGDAGVEIDQEASERLGALKDGLHRVLGNNTFDYTATWSGEGISTDHLGNLPEKLDECLSLLEQKGAPHTLCVDVWRSIAGMILSQLERLEAEEPVEREIASHARFGEARCRDFVGREAILNEIVSYVKGTGPELLAVTGESGSGKSAVLAKAREQAEAARPGATIVRFIGATPGSSDGRSLFGSLCRQIARALGGDESAIPVEYNDLAVEFGKQLEKATAQKPLIVFLDALDQLGTADPARSLSWLPGRLPEHVRIVVSTLPDTDCEVSLRAKYPEPRVLSLDRMNRAEGDIALGIWLGKVGRALTPDQRKEVLDRFEREGRPLYLRLAFEEARLWPSYAEASATKLHEGIPELIKGDLFARLEAPENHGQMLVSHALGYLGASRHGLSEDELLGVLSADKAVKDDFQARSPRSPAADQLPVVVWSRLYFDLEPYLSERGSDGAALLGFYHRVLAEAVTDQYLVAKEGPARHSALADYFIDRADPGYAERRKADEKAIRLWDGGSVRGLSETPFHLAGADRLDDLYTTLTDFHFLEHKTAEVGVVEHPGAGGEMTTVYTGVYALQDDYAIALPRFGGGSASVRRPLIITGVDFGEGLVIRCPWCNKQSPFQQQWRGTEIECPQCRGPLKINKFVVGESMFDVK